MSTEPLKNNRHELFCQNMAEGLSIGASYAKVYGTEKLIHASVNGTRLLKNDIVRARIGHLQAENEKKSLITREELLKILVDTLRSKPLDASMENSLCELKMSKAGPYAAFMDKTRAAERLCKMLGWDAAEKIEHSGAVGQVQIVVPENFVSRRGVTHGVS